MLARIVPNIRGPGSKKRETLLGGVTHSIPHMAQGYRDEEIPGDHSKLRKECAVP